MPFTDTSGTRIAWEESGSGEPLLLIMGATFTRKMWHRTIPALAEHFRVIWYDNRGFGESDRTTSSYSIADLARDAASVLDAAGVEAAHVYGVSMGGLTAQELALTYPDRVKSLVLGCTWAAAPDRRRASWTSELRYRIPTRLLLAASKPVLYGPRRDKQLVAEDMKILRSEPIERSELRAQGHAVLGYYSRERVSDLRLPALVLHGDHDRVIPFAWGQELAEVLPDARFVALDGAGHNYLTDSADQANTAVLAFLQTCQAAHGG